MAILTHSGRAALADAIKSQTLHLAWGRGSADWGTNQSVTKTFDAGDALALDHQSVSAVVVKSVDEVTTYANGTDYTVDAATGTLLRVVTGTIPSEGDVRVDYTVDTPNPSVTATGLSDEIGRRLVDEVEFAVEDENGAIAAPTGRFSVSVNPTRHLYVRTRFDFADASDQVIREQALFVGTVTDGALPPGQRYFEGAEVTDAGIMLLLQNSPALIRQPTSRETYEFVVSF